MEKTILLTGATGALGSELLPRLAERGYKVFCLVRAGNLAQAQRRIQNVAGRHKNIRAIRGDITETRCGISDMDREQLVGRIDQILHCAASISFTDKKATYNANVEGVRNVLELADILNVWRLNHVSTAYIGGNAPRFLESDSPSAMLQYRPRNIYEETKRIGESMIRAWALHREDRRCNIFRPSILVGREDGTSPTFDAYYGYFKPINWVAKAIRERAREGKNLPSDVSVESNGSVHVPLVIQASPRATLNLIPIDWTAQMMVELLETPLRNETYHLVHPTPPLVRWVIDTSLHFLKVQGVRVVETDAEKAAAVAEQSPVVQRLYQRQVDLVLNQYHPYTNHEIDLMMEKPQRTLGARFASPRTFDVDYMEALLGYAVKTNWGEKVPVPVMA